MGRNESSTQMRNIVKCPQTVGLEGAGDLSKDVLLDVVGPISGMVSQQITGGSSAALSQGQQTMQGVTLTVSLMRTGQEGKEKNLSVIHFWTGLAGLQLPAGQSAEPYLLMYRTTTQEEKEVQGAASGTNKMMSSLQLASPKKLVCI